MMFQTILHSEIFSGQNRAPAIHTDLLAIDQRPKFAVPSGRNCDLPMFILNFKPTSVEVSLQGRNQRIPIHQLMTNVQHSKENQADICNKEVLDTKRRNPRSKPLRQHNENVEK